MRRLALFAAILAVFAILAGFSALSGVASASILTYGSYGGNEFEVVSASSSSGITWGDANTAAISMGGFLAVIPDAGTNLFVSDLVSTVSAAAFNPTLGPWFGGYAPGTDNSGDPSQEHFQWGNGISAPAINFSPLPSNIWGSGQPDNAAPGLPQGILFFPSTSFTSLGYYQWGDYYTSGEPLSGLGLPNSFVVELPVPEPLSVVIWSLLGSLAIGLGWWRKRNAA